MCVTRQNSNIFTRTSTTLLISFLLISLFVQNHDRKTRTSVFVLVATELLDDWEDAKDIGKYNKGDSRPRHLQGKGEYTGSVRQAWGFSLFGPM